MRLIVAWMLLLVLAVGLPAARAQSVPAATQPVFDPEVHVTLSANVEDGKKQLIATVKRNDKPIANATVSFGVTRTFGRLVLGSDVTLDDGTAAIPFPSDLPGGPKGELEVTAMVQGPLSQWGALAQMTLPGGIPRQPPMESFPRALWSRRALGLIAVIATLVGGAWSAYLFVSYQLVVIRRGV